MFGYLRLFSIVSLLVVVALTALAGNSLRNVAIDYLTSISTKNNVSIAEGYISVVWKHDGKIVATIKSKTPEQLRNDPDILHFSQETTDYFRKMLIMRSNIYDSSGTLIMSTDAVSGNILSSGKPSPDDDFVANQLRGISPSSQIIKDAKLKNGAVGDVLQTIVPIKLSDKSDANNEGTLEIISDLSDPLSKLKYAQWVASAYIAGVFLMLLLILFIISKRAETIITRQHEANVDLAAAAAAAQAESHDKSQFLANVSHELRTPLNAIIGFSEIIKNSTISEDNHQRFEGYINDIHASGIHLLSLINDILDYSKAEAGKLELEVSEVNANKLVHNCIRLVIQRAENSQVRLVESLPKEQLKIITDSKKFKQILLNLLSNAIKFTNAGGEVRISAWADINNDSYVFEVKDSGIGIAPKDISRAMAPFGQVDNTLSRKYEGTGLGLPLTKKFVELLGGEFSITSEVGVGTTITFSLPREIKPMEGVIIKEAN